MFVCMYMLYTETERRISLSKRSSYQDKANNDITIFQFNLESKLDGQAFLLTERSCSWALITLVALFHLASSVTARQDVDPP